MKLLDFEIGLDRPFFLIAGPCVVESEGLVLDIAGRMGVTVRVVPRHGLVDTPTEFGRVAWAD